MQTLYAACAGTKKQPPCGKCGVDIRISFVRLKFLLLVLQTPLEVEHIASSNAFHNILSAYSHVPVILHVHKNSGERDKPAYTTCCCRFIRKGGYTLTIEPTFESRLYRALTTAGVFQLQHAVENQNIAALTGTKRAAETAPGQWVQYYTTDGSKNIGMDHVQRRG